MESIMKEMSNNSLQNEETRVTVEMTAEEKARFEAFQKSEAKRAAEEKARADREMYKQMVDEEIENSIWTIFELSWI